MASENLPAGSSQIEIRLPTAIPGAPGWPHSGLFVVVVLPFARCSTPAETHRPGRARGHSPTFFADARPTQNSRYVNDTVFDLPGLMLPRPYVINPARSLGGPSMAVCVGVA